MLEIKYIYAGYGGSAVLHGVGLTIAEGSVTALMGRNGMGKTTLCKVCMGLLRPRSGEVLLDGTDILALPPHEIARRGVAYVPQGREVFEGFTVEDNLRLGLAGRGRARARVPAEIFEWFPALGPLRCRPAGTLSGGEQQMLAIGRALAAGPRLLLLDEPSEGLQPSIVHQIAQILARIVADGGLTVLLVEQNVELVQTLAGECAFLVDGVIAETMPAAGLASETDALRRHLAL